MKKNWVLGAALAALFIMAFATRLYLANALPHISEDGVIYAKSAAQLLKGESFSATYRPFYPLMISLFSRLCADLELAGNFATAFYGALLIFPLFFMARWAFGNKVAVISCLLAVIYPVLCEFSSGVISESTFIFFFMLGLILSWLAISKGRPFYYLLAGITWAIAFLTRSEGSAYFLFLVLMIFIKFFQERKIKWLGYLSLATAGFLIICFPYLLNLKKETGHWTLEKRSAIVFALAENIGQKEDWGVAFDRSLFGLSPDGKKVGYEVILGQDKGLVSYFLESPGKIFKRYIINLHLINKYVIPGLFYPVIIFLFAAGLLLGDIKKAKKAAVLFLAFIPYSIAPIVPVAERYFLLFVPIILIWAARGIVEVAGWLARKGRNPDAAVSRPDKKQVLLEAALVILVLVSFAPATFRPYLRNEAGPKIYREIGLWINKNLPGDAVLICRKPWIPFYAGKEQVPLPFAAFDEIIKFARYRKAGYLIADENVSSNRSDLGFLLEESFAFQDLRLIQKFKDNSGRKIYLYQILG